MSSSVGRDAVPDQMSAKAHEAFDWVRSERIESLKLVVEDLPLGNPIALTLAFALILTMGCGLVFGLGLGGFVLNHVEKLEPFDRWFLGQ